MADAEHPTDGRAEEAREDADLLATTHLHHSEAEKEAHAHPDWLPAKIPESIGAFVVFLLMVGVSGGVLLRYMGQGVLGLVELASLSMLVVVVLGAAGLSYRDEHVRLEVLDTALKEKGINRLELFVDAVQIVVVAVVIYALLEVFRLDLVSGTTLSGELGIPRKWVSGTAMVCFALVLIVLLRKTITDVRIVRRRYDR